MMLAHSSKDEKTPQTYKSHVDGVVSKTLSNFDKITGFISEEISEEKCKTLKNTLTLAAYFHDLGKLDEKNQSVLNGKLHTSHLPIPHRDAGVKHILNNFRNQNAAALIYAHHSPGLPNINEEKVSRFPFRTTDDTQRSHTDENLDEYLRIHNKIIEMPPLVPIEQKKFSSFDFRISLSCLVDADYSDTAGNNLIAPNTRWEERIEKLDEYIKELQSRNSDKSDSLKQRSDLRQQMYSHCKDNLPNANIVYCDSPVGTGKTTAVMAHLLNVARKRRLRHIIVVLPYTNIITQAVKVYRKALVLDGEKPEEIIAEHHHQADYEDISMRELATTWNAPIIVTTAVQFFESLASNLPSKLRKIHQLPGSAIFIDESHAALPTKLMPLAWKMIADLSKNWGCYFCLCSGTSIKYWKNTAFKEIANINVQPLLSEDLSNKLRIFEENRVQNNFIRSKPPELKSAEELINFIIEKEGPRLVVMNTVKSAAALAQKMKSDGKDVLHLSTALAPCDREEILMKIYKRLENKDDVNWTLVSTSCIECGVDFSFRNGFCELRSLQSCHQLSGRVGRNGEYQDAHLYCFSVNDPIFSENRTFQISIEVFKKLIDGEKLIDKTITEAVTLGFEMECKEKGGLDLELCKSEKLLKFKEVAELFRVIDDDTYTVVADMKLINKIKSKNLISSIELVKGSVNMRKSYIDRLKLNSLEKYGYPELYELAEEQYDSNFLGYMKGLFNLEPEFNCYIK